MTGVCVLENTELIYVDGDGQSSSGHPVRKKTNTTNFGTNVSDEHIPLHPFKMQKTSSQTLKYSVYIHERRGGMKGKKSTNKGTKTVNE